MATKTTVKIPGPTAAETELQQIQVDLARQQLEATTAQTAAAAPALRQLTQQQELLEELFTPEQQRERLQEQIAFEDQFRPIQQELLERELERIRRGPGASEEELRLIGEATERGIASGESDISEFRRLGLQQIREELAPASGLRPTDTPIVERGLQLGREAQRQQGQLVRGLRGAEATAALNFPLASQQFQQAQSFGLQQLASSAQQFQSQLRQQAFQNQLRLAGGAAGTGASALGGITGGLGGLQQVRLSQTEGSTRDFIRSAQAVGGAVAGGLALSSRRFKNTFGSVNVQRILEAVRDLDVDHWQYKDGFKDSTEFGNMAHIGPYAEDFGKAFEVDTGDGTYIRTIDALGVLFAAVKALAIRQEELNVGTA